jgi:hypothetical protein
MPSPPPGYTLAPQPPPGYSPTIQATTNEGEPYWVSDAVGRPAAVPAANPADGRRALSYVEPHDTSKVNVVLPQNYTPDVAAHETTHIFQNSRNDDFNRSQDELQNKPGNIAGMGSNRESQAAAYDYGGVKGLRANPLRSVGNYNREQQAQMVQDLAVAQNNIHPGMSKPELANWDETKKTLERPIEQLQRIPAKSAPTVSSKVDDWLAQHTIFGDRPLERARGILSPPTIDTRPLGTPEAPSTALGYANLSEDVRSPAAKFKEATDKRKR